MTYLQTHKKALVLSLMIGLLIALMTRASLVVFTTDLSYINFFGIVYPPPIEFDFSSTGKKVIGASGFPFTAAIDCAMGPHGTIASPACENHSWLWGYSIIPNTLFWALVIYGISMVIQKFKRMKSVL